MTTMQQIEQSILDCLSATGAETVSALRDRTAYAHYNARSQSTLHTAVLKQLEARGLVRRLDDQKPIAWLRVDAPQGA